MEVANTLAYYDTATITAVKSFIVQAPGAIKYAPRVIKYAPRAIKYAPREHLIYWLHLQLSLTIVI
jgi:hypothetical protein